MVMLAALIEKIMQHTARLRFSATLHICIELTPVCRWLVRRCPLERGKWLVLQLRRMLGCAHDLVPVAIPAVAVLTATNDSASGELMPDDLVVPTPAFDIEVSPEGRLQADLLVAV